MSIGSTVLYVLSASDAELINARRTTTESVKNRQQRNPPEWPTGAQAHLGDPVREGDVVPMLVTRETETGEMISGHAFLQGNDVWWVAAAEFVEDDAPEPGQAASLDNRAWQVVKRELTSRRAK